MPKKFIAKVVSDKTDKTVQVNLVRRMTHPLYGKQYTNSRRLAVHDPKNVAQVGDLVEITEIRPVSATKRFALKRVVESGQGVVELKDEEAV
ncbi:MAG: 30S ribosomal protein S17 [Candidatus Chaera renei]|uniref:Small ribosomal subunit protein uS17 n=1 Tax=Candidatus Chaera renei TaxID=2506947 RepID=A0A4V1J7N1_9BACT|nr:MAG: 30S ribosomal protein S17 [Candidatus Chaera renei]